MKIIVLHGQDVNKSYLRLTKFIDEARKRNWETLYDNLSVSQSLFGNEFLIIIRYLKLITAKNIEPLEKIDGTLVIYSDKDLPAAFLKSLPKKDTKIEKFDLPKIIWNFLNKPTVKVLHQVIKTEALEFVFIMLYRQIKKQKKYDLVSKFAQIDIDYKTGKADLLTSLDLLIAKYIQ